MKNQDSKSKSEALPFASVFTEVFVLVLELAITGVGLLISKTSNKAFDRITKGERK